MIDRIHSKIEIIFRYLNAFQRMLKRTEMEGKKFEMTSEEKKSLVLAFLSGREGDFIKEIFEKEKSRIDEERKNLEKIQKGKLEKFKEKINAEKSD